jgi:hypothetical protein
MAAILGGRLWIVKPNHSQEINQHFSKNPMRCEENIPKGKMDCLDRFFDHPLMLSFTILIRSSLFFRHSPGPHIETMAH